MKQIKLLSYNNGMYQGYLDQSYRKCGFGVFLYDDSMMYIGEWKNDQYHGDGILILPFGGYFSGKFQRHSIEGIGAMVTTEELSIGYFDKCLLQGRVLKWQQNKWKLLNYANGLELNIIQQEMLGCRHAPQFLQNDDPLLDKLRSVQRNIFQRYFQHNMELLPNGFFIGFKDGLGVLFDDKIKIGQFKDMILDGVGRIVKPNGDVLDGYFKKSVLQQGFLYQYETNSFQEIQLVVGKELLESKYLSDGKQFPSKQISNKQNNIGRQREQIHSIAKTYMDKSQDKPFYQQYFIEISQQSQANPILPYINYINQLNMYISVKQILDDTVDDEGTTQRPSESIQRPQQYQPLSKRQSQHYNDLSIISITSIDIPPENLQELYKSKNASTNVKQLLPFTNRSVFDPLPLLQFQTITQHQTQREKKRIFD